MKKLIIVGGMSCSHCEHAVKDALEKLPEVSSVKVYLDSKEVEVEGKNLQDDLMKKAVENSGYEVLEIK